MDTEKQEDRLEYLERMSHRQFLILREYKEQLARLDHLSSMMRMDPLGHLNLSDNNSSQDLIPEVATNMVEEVAIQPQHQPQQQPQQEGATTLEAVVETTETVKPTDKTETETVTETELAEVEVKETAETIQEEMTESEVVQQAEVVVEPEEKTIE
jgi:hypothetical protein